MIYNELRQAVFERDNYTCQYCGHSGNEADLEVDHIIPICKGGNNDMRNLCTACKTCNRKKGAKILTISELQQIAGKINSSLDFFMSISSEKPQAEKRMEKMKLYFKPELLEKIRDWCYLKRISCVSYITALIEADLKTDDKQKKLAFFREMSNDA